MTQTEKVPAPALMDSRERQVVLLLCCLAAVHVFIFSAAFPFFNNVDEPMHFDLVIKYSQGHVPSGLESFSPASLPYLVIYATREYAQQPEDFVGHHFPAPFWTQPPETNQPEIRGWTDFWRKTINYEISQPPLYYALSGLWWNFCQWIGFTNGWLLYCLRFLNIFVVTATVGLAYAIARTLFPRNMFVRLGVPSIVAFMPQTAFYSIDNDILSPLCFGVAFFYLTKFFRSEIPEKWLGAYIGLALAATLLLKMTNLPLFATALGIVFLKAWRSAKIGKLRVLLPSLFWLLACAAPPVIWWLAWCKCHFGDFTGTQIKIDFLTWTLKPVGEWWHHQIFTPAGLWAYLSGQLTTFWQGEFAWHGRHLGTPLANSIYTTLSLILPAIGLTCLFEQSDSIKPAQREALWFAFAACAAMMVFFAFFSIIYDFHDCSNPSRMRPYFHSGRLLLGALIPFLLLFVYGLDRALNHFGNTVKFSTLIGMLLCMQVFETATDWPVFSSQYNWFHM